MRAFEYQTAATPKDALAKSATRSAYIAGGTTLIDLMKLDVMMPSRLIDINGLGLHGISLDADFLRIGALEKMATVADHSGVQKQYPVIAEALLKSASAQLRNMASIGGNLMQRTRCSYFRDTSSECNKRVPGSGCPAFGGENRMHAILGVSDACCATHPSDLAVALVALDASLQLAGANGARTIFLADFYLKPGETPEKEHAIQEGELITQVLVPAGAFTRRSTYVKVRDRESYEFALTSAAVALDLDGSTVKDARIALGGVGTVPWRAEASAAALRGQTLNEASLRNVADLAVEGARPLSGNAFKINLIRRTLMSALNQAGEIA